MWSVGELEQWHALLRSATRNNEEVATIRFGEAAVSFGEF